MGKMPIPWLILIKNDYFSINYLAHWQACYLKISSYLPFHAEFYFNGHNAIRLELDKRGIRYTKKENAFTLADEPETLQEIANSIDGYTVQNRIDYWMNLFFKFDKGTYSTRSKHLQHEWYMTQVEVCSNIVFKSARFCTNLFERILDKFSRFGLPDSIAQVFDKRPYRSGSKQFRRLYDNNACMKTWFRGNAIKQYNKTGYYIRTETTVNTPTNRWGWKNLPAFCRPICGSALAVTTVFSTAALMSILPPSLTGRKISLPNQFQTTRAEMWHRRTWENLVNWLFARNCSSPNTKPMASGPRAYLTAAGPLSKSRSNPLWNQKIDRARSDKKEEKCVILPGYRHRLEMVMGFNFLD